MYAALIARSSLYRGLFRNTARFYATNGPKKPRITNPPPPPKAASQASAPKTSPTEPETQNATTSSSALPSLDISPAVEEEQPQERTGAKSSKDSLSSIERKRRFMGRVSLAVLLLGTAVQTWYLGREWEADELKDKRMVRHGLVRSFSH